MAIDTSDPQYSANNAFMASLLGPMAPYMLLAAQDPNSAAHLLAFQGPPPGGTQVASAGDAGTGTGSTTITPQTRTPGDAGAMASSTLPTGQPDQAPPNTMGITGSDGQSVQPPPPLSFAGSQPPPQVAELLYKGQGGGQPSGKDQATNQGTDTVNPATSGTDAGSGGGDLTAGEILSAAQDTTDPSMAFGGGTDGMSKVAQGLGTAGKVLGSLQAPSDNIPKYGWAPLPGHESRFTPQDLLQMIQTLGQAGSRQQPQSLGALIGR